MCGCCLTRVFFPKLLKQRLQILVDQLVELRVSLEIRVLRLQQRILVTLTQVEIQLEALLQVEILAKVEILQQVKIQLKAEVLQQTKTQQKVEVQVLYILR